MFADPVFPPLDAATPDGLLAVGGDLSVPMLLCAYRRGIFPWFCAGQPILWWSPDPRMILVPEELRLHRSLRQAMAKPGITVRIDTAFAEVMSACANAPRRGQEGTWIVQEMQEAYCALHEAGFAHSIETWAGDELIGGLYGVSIGRMFFGESMFTRRPNASKIALAHLARRLQKEDFPMIDCQMNTAHLAFMGAREIPRSTFAAQVARLVELPPAVWEKGDVACR
ncbi:MAG: leucyl/phenylalanyl-tRNA--protein transferase [Zoogloeaceae bacterium]|jgi:leucyl/phenylalanyl-tRNA--protein transferase|nr:leucyl/phenylalanyl-tRNA--protein transferase [Zoogloeaceae bacterium]